MIVLKWKKIFLLLSRTVIFMQKSLIQNNNNNNNLLPLLLQESPLNSGFPWPIKIFVRYCFHLFLTVGTSSSSWVFYQWKSFYVERGASPLQQLPTWRTRLSLFVRTLTWTRLTWVALPGNENNNILFKYTLNLQK